MHLGEEGLTHELSLQSCVPQDRATLSWFVAWKGILLQPFNFPKPLVRGTCRGRKRENTLLQKFDFCQLAEEGDGWGKAAVNRGMLWETGGQ